MCDGSCGWVAAIVGALAQGSYAVPVKATKDVDVHPLILQTYKTIVLAFTSCIVVPLITYLNSDEKSHASIRFTPFGILSGALWVLGGSCGIYGIRNAGVAIAVGTWAAVMVCVNFTWGILIFREPVHSLSESCLAFGLLLVGLGGMSKYSAGNNMTGSKAEQDTEEEDHENSIHLNGTEDGPSSIWDAEMSVAPSDVMTKMISNDTSTRRLANRGGNVTSTNGSSSFAIGSNGDVISEENDNNNNHWSRSSMTTSLLKKVNGIVYGDENDCRDGDRHKKPSWINLNPLAIWYRLVTLAPTAFTALSPRQAGIFMAALNGILGGSSLIPLHYAKKRGFAGLTYIPSFGLGSFISNMGLWSLYFAWTYYQQQRQSRSQQQRQQGTERDNASSSADIWKSSVDLMPSFHWSKLWKRGLLAGFLLSIGMVCTILATGALGQGVGNSLVQSKILVSGLWGIIYYKEIKNRRSIQLWFLSAIVCVCGILGLCYERLVATQEAALDASFTRAAASMAVASIIDISAMNVPVQLGEDAAS